MGKSSTTNTAAVLHGAADLRLEERQVVAPGPGMAQVKIMSTTLCGSDLHYYAHGRNGTFQLQHPLVLGHESAGIVTAVGPGVSPSTIRVGMRVAIECGIPCKNKSGSSCTHCKSGRYNLCPNLRFCSSAKTHPHLDGTLQSVLTHPADLLHPLPPSMSFDQGALAEPLGVIIHASRRAAASGEGGGVKPGSNVLVFGAGAVGLMACLLSRAQGAKKIVCVDVNDDRLKFAKTQGFVGITFNSNTNAPPPLASLLPANATPQQVLQATMDRAKAVATNIRAAAGMKMVDDEGFDVVFECTGAEPCIQAGIYASRLGGKVMLVGMGTPNVSLPLSAAACREVDLIGVFRYANTYPAALALLSSGALDGVEKMITHRFSLDETERAFEVMKRGVDDQGRLVVKVCVEDR